MERVTQTRRWFDWWRSRATFIEGLDPKANFYEANVLVWAAFDALAGHWARCLHVDLQDGTDRRRFGEFLSRLGGGDNAFERVSARATPAVRDRLRQLRGRRSANVLEQRQARTPNDDPLAKDLLAEIADIAANKVRAQMTARDVVLRSRFGEIAYEEMRCAVVHEGQPGPSTHSFDFGTESDDGPTYLSGLFTAPPSIGFSIRYMAKVLRTCLDAFEGEALSVGVTPSQEPRRCIVLKLDGEEP